jgi:drug/metabolite transporter (DMT)-like permease
MFLFAYFKNVMQYIQPQHIIRFIFLGFCSFTSVVGTIICLQYISATRYALFQVTVPCIGTVISIAIGFETLTIVKGCGVIVSVAGAILIEAWKTGSTSDHESNPTLGTIIVSIQVLAFACLIVFQKPLVEYYDPAYVTFLYYSIGALFTVILCVCWESRFTVDSFRFNGLLLPWLGVVYAAIFATLYVYNAYAWAGKRLPPTILAVYSTLQPVGTAILSLIVFGEVISVSEVVGGLLVVIGLVMTVYGKRSNEIELEFIPVEDADFESGGEHIFINDACINPMTVVISKEDDKDLTINFDSYSK